MSGYSRSYKITATRTKRGVVTLVKYSMLPPLTGEVTPVGYQIVFLNEAAVTSASDATWTAEVKKFLAAINMPSNNIDSYASLATRSKNACKSIGAYIATFSPFINSQGVQLSAKIALNEPAYSGFTVYAEYTTCRKTRHSLNFVFGAGETEKVVAVTDAKYDSITYPAIKILPHESYYIDATKWYGGQTSEVIEADTSIPQIWMDYSKTPTYTHNATQTFITWYTKNNKPFTDSTAKIYIDTVEVGDELYSGIEHEFPAYVGGVRGSFTTVHPKKSTSVTITASIITDKAFIPNGTNNVNGDYTNVKYLHFRDVDNHELSTSGYYGWAKTKGKIYIPSRSSWYEPYSGVYRTFHTNSITIQP
jgi:hypothetical protein